jgi:hypothetical protein
MIAFGIVVFTFYLVDLLCPVSTFRFAQDHLVFFYSR